MLDVDHRMPKCACLECGYEADMSSSLDNGPPRPGDVTICIKCGHLMAFADDLTFRPLSDSEIHTVAGDPRILTIQWARANAVEGKQIPPPPAVRRFLMSVKAREWLKRR